MVVACSCFKACRYRTLHERYRSVLASEIIGKSTICSITSSSWQLRKYNSYAIAPMTSSWIDIRSSICKVLSGLGVSMPNLSGSGFIFSNSFFFKSGQFAKPEICENCFGKLLRLLGPSDQWYLPTSFNFTMSFERQYLINVVVFGIKTCEHQK